jgi:hypothetical protein
MPPEADTIEALTTEDKPFGAPIGEIWDNMFPEGEEKPEPTEETTEEPEKVEPKVEKKIAPTKAKEEKPKEETKEFVPDSVFSDKPEEKKEEVTTEPEPTPIPPTIKTETARKSFADLDEKRIAAEKRALELEKRAVAAEEKAKAGDPDAKVRIEALEKQLQSADSLVQKALLQEHPQFQARYVVPRQQLLEQAKSAFKDAGGDPSLIESALELKGKARVDKLDELLGEVSSKILSNKLESAVTGIDRIDSEREQVLRNAANVNKQLQANDQINRSKAFQELEVNTKNDLTEASTILSDKFKIGIFKRSSDPKFAEFNAAIDKIDTAAEHIMLRTEDRKEMAIAAKMAAGFPLVWGLLQDKHKQNQALAKRLADYEEAEPGLGGRTSRKVASKTEEHDEELPLADAIKASIKRSQELG